MPITLTCTSCGNAYQLKDEFAGRKLRCPGCESVQVVPEASSDPATAHSWESQEAEAGAFHPAFRHDKFLLRQKMMTVGSKYLVWDEEQRPLLFVERSLHFWRQILGALGAVFAAIAVAFVGIMISVSLTGAASGVVAVGTL